MLLYLPVVCMYVCTSAQKIWVAGKPLAGLYWTLKHFNPTQNKNSLSLSLSGPVRPADYRAVQHHILEQHASQQATKSPEGGVKYRCTHFSFNV